MCDKSTGDATLDSRINSGSDSEAIPRSDLTRDPALNSVVEPAASPINGLTFAPEWAGTNIFIQCQPVDLKVEQLFPAELALIETAAERRQSTFSSGRVCARQALAEAGFEPMELTRCEDGSVAWPDAVIGSLTHTDDWAVAAIAVPAMSDAIALGIDLEKIKALDDGVLKLIATDEERSELESTNRPDWQATALFSLKESIYKCLAADYGQFIEFHDVQITRVASGKPRLQFLSESLAAQFDAALVELRMAVTPQHVFTLAWLRESFAAE